jgi:regulator of sigma E protease
MLEIVVLFIISLLLVVVVHELGHFFVSKRVGVEVEEFGIGFPPRLFGRMWRGTLYSLNALPVGAFVKSRGENDPTIEGSLAAKSPWKRFAVYAAGPFSNILLGFLLFTAFFVLPRAAVVSDGLLVYEVQGDSAAAEAGLVSGDVIAAAGGTELETWVELQEVLARVEPGNSVTLEVVRESERFSVGVSPEYSETLKRNIVGVTLGRNIVTAVSEDSIAHEGGVQEGDSLLALNGRGVVNQSELEELLRGTAETEEVVLSLLRSGQAYTVEAPAGSLSFDDVGIELQWAPGSRIERRSISLGSAALSSATYIVSMPALIVASAPLIREDPSLAFVGPIGAGQMTVEAVQTFGFSNLVFIAALISIGIALFNLIPIPPLDGGGMLVALVEATMRGRRLSQRALRLAYAGGTALLITLVIFITTSDLLRLIQGRGFGF